MQNREMLGIEVVCLYDYEQNEKYIFRIKSLFITRFIDSKLSALLIEERTNIYLHQ